MWAIAAISSYCMSAGIHVADKFLLSNKIHSSIVYAFFVGIWSFLNVILLFFEPWVPDAREMAIDFSAGLLFLATLVFWYKALHQSEATRVVPLVGALIPIFSLLLSAFLLGESISNRQLIAFFILIFGGVLISVRQARFYVLHELYEKLKNKLGNMLGLVHAEYRPTSRMLIYSFLSAFCFALFYVLMKYIYLHQPFIGGFVWSRLGSFIGALIILLVPSWHEKIRDHKEEAQDPGNIFFFMLIRLVASVSFIVFNFAISLGNVAMVNALQGTQYLFLIAIVLIISSRFPKLLKDEFSRAVMPQKLIGIAIIGLGLYVLAG